MLPRITKTEYEEITRYHQFKRADGYGWLGDGETLSSGTVTVTDSDGNTQSSMVSDVAVYNDTKIQYKLAGGSAGETYTISIKSISSTGDKLEDKIALTVT